MYYKIYYYILSFVQIRDSLHMLTVLARSLTLFWLPLKYSTV